MTDMILYAVPVVEAGQTRAEGVQSQQQAVQALLGADIGNVESIAPDPGERTVTVEFPDEYGAIRAAELAELANSLSQPLPYHSDGQGSRDDGYVTASRAQVEPIDPRSKQFQRATLTLSEVGTPWSHWRAVRTNPQSVDNPFGSAGIVEVGVPAAASKVRWLDEETGTRSAATVQVTRSAKGGDVDVYDASAPSIDQPTLIYDIDLADTAFTDPRVWDDRGQGSVTDGQNRVQWQKVFATEHRYDGQTVVENGLIRLFFNESASPGITAEDWDDGTSSWVSESLGSSSWELFDVDIRRIGTAIVSGRCEFTDGSSFHSLDFELARGFANVLWSNPPSEGTVPTGLTDLLSPIAEANGSTAAPRQSLVARDEVV